MELGSFCLELILLAMFRKYLLNAFAILWQSLSVFPSRYKLSVLSVLSDLLVSKFTIYQIVLFLFKDFLILYAQFSFFASLLTADNILQYFL